MKFGQSRCGLGGESGFDVAASIDPFVLSNVRKTKIGAEVYDASSSFEGLTCGGHRNACGRAADDRVHFSGTAEKFLVAYEDEPASPQIRVCLLESFPPQGADCGDLDVRVTEEQSASLAAGMPRTS
jgi:hypothetical protein